MGLEFVSHQTRPISPARVRALFDAEGWWPDRAEGDIEELLEHGPAIGVWDGEELIGFGRAVTDGVCRAYLEDVIVGRGQRGRGIGSELIRALHHELGDQVTVSAFFHRSLEDFYGGLGYVSTHQVVAHRREPPG